MKKFFFQILSLAIVGVMILSSCLKDHSCETCQNKNQPPIARAGDDQSVQLPEDSVTLDGSGSSDPDGNIVKWNWTSLSGPATFLIADSTAEKAHLSHLKVGIYEFELTVTDAEGLSAKDTVQVIVHTSETAVACDGSIRPQIAAKLIRVGTLPTPRDAMTVGSVGPKLVFAGGVSNIVCTDAVDLYDTLTHQWSKARLSQARMGMTAVAAGSKLFLAGGSWSEGDPGILYTNIDVYDAVTDSWSVMQLSEKRSYVAGAALGNKVFFAGGGVVDYWNTSTAYAAFPFSNKVDIYDLSTDTWSTARLSEARCNSSVVVVGNKVYFAGGFNDKEKSLSNHIDVYDGVTQSWSTASLLRPMGWIAGAAIGDKICWAESCGAEIKNATTGTSASHSLWRSGLWNTDIGANAVTRGANIAFFRHRTTNYDFSDFGDRFDIYNAATDTWSVGVLPEKLYVNAVISVNNTIYLVGGANGQEYKSQVWKVEF